MLNSEDMEWIKSNRTEISETRQIGANFYYKGYTNEDIDTGEPGTIYDTLPPILVSGIFKDNGTQKIIVESSSGTEMQTKLLFFIYNAENLYYILENNNKVVKTDTDALNYLGLPTIPIGYKEKLDKLEIPANSGDYYAIIDSKQTGMGSDFNKVVLNLVDYYRIF